MSRGVQSIVAEPGVCERFRLGVQLVKNSQILAPASALTFFRIYFFFYLWIWIFQTSPSAILILAEFTSVMLLLLCTGSGISTVLTSPVQSPHRRTPRPQLRPGLRRPVMWAQLVTWL
jgi:hypothetical protein